MECKVLDSLPEHYERYLGMISHGWMDRISETKVSIVSFMGRPEPNVTTFATLGLSRSILNLREDHKIRQELLVSANDTFLQTAIAAFLLSIAEDLIKRGQALLRGEVIGPGKPVIDGAATTAVYVANPSPFDKLLTEFPSVPPTVFAYLVPITSTEAALVREHGWDWFENALEKQNPDIWDLARCKEIRFRS